jgi:hypothetical protein
MALATRRIRSAALICAGLGAFAGESESIFERPVIVSADYNRPEAVPCGLPVDSDNSLYASKARVYPCCSNASFHEFIPTPLRDTQRSGSVANGVAPRLLSTLKR